ncbi:hypothetical protein AVEN_190281-1 [Araneus ventricosus]|uniref:Uncharacterized protein n=1 Tax=Araneus ventricosus TaxID=182803 RepID=A0A4Y2IV95_ARAVE|nr:hypothetical protein AVEN_190281-1 [Araneus ventricosus]
MQIPLLGGHLTLTDLIRNLHLHTPNHQRIGFHLVSNHQWNLVSNSTPLRSLNSATMAQSRIGIDLHTPNHQWIGFHLVSSHQWNLVSNSTPLRSLNSSTRAQSRIGITDI